MAVRPRERRGRLLFAVPLGLVVALMSGAASSAEGPTIEAAGGSSFYWNPVSAQTAPGGTVTFKNASGSVPHGVTWTGGPETPPCSNVPINDGKTSWTGTCSFNQAGTYSFYCPVHPTEMKGTITASAGGPSTATPTPTPANPAAASPLQGPASQALKLASSQQGTAVRGSVNLSSVAVGGKLEIELLLMARSALTDSGRVGRVRAGRLVRGALREGRVPFAVSLTRVARKALQAHGRLSLKVRLSLTPPGGKALILNRSVAIHD